MLLRCESRLWGLQGRHFPSQCFLDLWLLSGAVATTTWQPAED